MTLHRPFFFVRSFTGHPARFKDRGLIFVSLSPGGVKTDMDDFGIAPMTASESVAHCVSFVSRMTIEDGGQLRNYDGSKSIVADKPR